ncbi:alpha/beta hydrolase [Chelativorans sp.]|uniref:alpha/beta fold hydrolase n=1 Tax=Chelativorans sp. TaxID=2203393 RepID=UPI002810AD5E|nr:alpha/beta hydrolase [Chelativorans sp.]
MGSEAGSIEISEGHLAYESCGEGSPPIVLLHGFSFDMRAWEPQVSLLARRHRVVRYDLRGFGKSSLPRSQYDHAEDLARVLDVLRLDRPLLVGLSLGANVSLAFAAKFPGRIAGLVLASPGLPGYEWKEERPPDAARNYARIYGVEAGKRFWLSHPLFASLADRPDALEAVRAMVTDYSGWHWQNPDLQAPSLPLRDLLEEIRVPALVLKGERDVGGYGEIAELLAERLPCARVKRFLRAGHMVNLEESEAFSAAVLEFAASLNWQKPEKATSKGAVS